MGGDWDELFIHGRSLKFERRCGDELKARHESAINPIPNSNSICVNMSRGAAKATTTNPIPTGAAISHRGLLIGIRQTPTLIDVSGM